MTRRIGFGLIAAFAVAGPLSLVVSGQNYSTPPPLVITAFGGKPAPVYKTPMTPWGDPDLQGTGRVTTRMAFRWRAAAGGGAAAPTGLYRTDAEVAQRAAADRRAARSAPRPMRPAPSAPTSAGARLHRRR